MNTLPLGILAATTFICTLTSMALEAHANHANNPEPWETAALATSTIALGALVATGLAALGLLATTLAG